MKTPIGRQDEEFMRSAWDWAGECHEAHNAGVRVSLTPTTRKGIWKLSAQAVDVVDGRAVGIRVKYDVEFPGVNHQTLAGALMAGLMTLDHQLGSDALDKEERV